MHEDMQYLRQRVDGVADLLGRNTVILEQNTESLREHMRRTAMLEEQMRTALIPIKLVKWLGLLMSLIGTIIGGIMGIEQLLK